MITASFVTKDVDPGYFFSGCMGGLEIGGDR